MGSSTHDLLLEKIQKKLVLVFEYAKPELFSLNFENSLEYLETKTNNNSAEIPLQRSSITSKAADFNQKRLSTLKHFISRDLIRSENGTYEFIPWESKYSSIFECILDLSQKFSYSEILKHISWQEFECFIMECLTMIGFHSIRTFRFQFQNRRFEIDCISLQYDQILFIDAKNWGSKTISMGKLADALEKQAERVKYVANDKKIFHKLLAQLQPSSNIRKFRCYPLILVSSPVSEILLLDCGVVLSFSKFNYFLNHFTEYKDLLNSTEIIL